MQKSLKKKASNQTRPRDQSPKEKNKTHLKHFETHTQPTTRPGSQISVLNNQNLLHLIPAFIGSGSFCQKPWASTPNGPKGYLNNQSRRCIPHIPWGTGTPLSFSNLLVGENSIVVEWVRTEQAYNMDDWKKCARGGLSSAVSFTRWWFSHTLTHVTVCRRIWAGIGNHSCVTMANLLLGSSVPKHLYLSNGQESKRQGLKGLSFPSHSINIIN